MEIDGKTLADHVFELPTFTIDFMLDVAHICLRSRLICFKDPTMNYEPFSHVTLFFLLHQGGFSPAPVGEGTLQLATVTALHGWSYSAWIHWYWWINQSPLMKLYIMYFKAIFSSLGIPSWNKLLNGRMVASLLRSLPQSWLLNLPRAKLLVEEDSQTEIPNMFGHPQLHGFPWSWKGFL